MKTSQMAACLQHIAPLADANSGEEIMRFAEALAIEGSKPFGTLAAKLEKGLKAKGSLLALSPASDLVQRIAKISAAAGSAPISKDFAATARILELLAGVEASQIGTVVADALAPASKKASPAKASLVDTREMADRLTAAVNDNAKFDALVNELRKLPKDTLSDIAQRFLGTSRQFKSKPEIVKSIRARQLQDALDASRERRISKIAV